MEGVSDPREGVSEGEHDPRERGKLTGPAGGGERPAGGRPAGWVEHPS